MLLGGARVRQATGERLTTVTWSRGRPPGASVLRTGGSLADRLDPEVTPLRFPVLHQGGGVGVERDLAADHDEQAPGERRGHREVLLDYEQPDTLGDEVAAGVDECVHR